MHTVHSTRRMAALTHKVPVYAQLWHHRTMCPVACTVVTCLGFMDWHCQHPIPPNSWAACTCTLYVHWSCCTCTSCTLVLLYLYFMYIGPVVPVLHIHWSCCTCTSRTLVLLYLYSTCIGTCTVCIIDQSMGL